VRRTPEPPAANPRPAFTYSEVGATAGATATASPLPAGYRHLRHTTRIASAQDGVDLTALGEWILTWRMHRALGVGIAPSAPRAAAGVRVDVTLGPRLGPGRRLGVTAPCQVVWSVADGTRAGFAYGTLPGHPECGEEAFVLERAPDGSLRFTVTAFSRPARWYTRAAGPLVPLFQRLYARRCAQVVRRAARARAVSRSSS